ncbi:MAG: hypothetical protein ABSH50_14500 [Bryobacteraceae bacterium]
MPDLNRPFRLLFGIALCASGASAANIGFQVNGNCLDGSCPSQPLGFSSTASLPLANTVTLANGDVYSITGTLSCANNSNGSLVNVYYLFLVTYRGNAGASCPAGEICGTGPSQADTLTMDLISAFQTNASSGDFVEILEGTFGSTVAASSSAQICTVGNICTPTTNPPGSFDVSASFPQPPSNGAFYFDFTTTAVFGAGSPVGSYILFDYPAFPLPNIVAAVSASAFGEFPTFAPGSWIEIYGTNLAAGAETWGTIDFSGPGGVDGPTTLGGTNVTIAGLPAFVDYVSPLQVNVQVPGGVPTGPQPIVVQTAVGSSPPFTATVNTTEPGLLAPPNFKIDGTQYVVAQFADGTYVLPPGALSGINSQVAAPGDTIVIYGIGFGSVSPNIPPGQLVEQANTLAAPFTISFGGVPATTVPYDGLAPDYMGLYQINVVVPAVAASNTVPLTFTLGSASGAQTLAIPIGN